MRLRFGFTIVELLVVIAIIVVLASLAVINYGAARREAREKVLIVHMKGISQAVQAYRGEDFYRFPHRLSHLVPDYINDPRVLLDPMDLYNGAEGCKPPVAGDQYEFLDDGPGVDRFYPNSAVSDAKLWPNSFIYPFANVPIDAGFYSYITSGFDLTAGTTVDMLKEPVPTGATISWKEGKLFQLRNGDSWSRGQGLKGYNEHWFPLCRSFWHMKNPDDSKEEKVAAVSLDGTFWWTTPKWENDYMKKIGKTPETN